MRHRGNQGTNDSRKVDGDHVDDDNNYYNNNYQYDYTDSGTDTDGEDSGGRRVSRVRYEKYTHRWYDSIVLTMSSALFFIPAGEAYLCMRWDNYAFILFVTSLLTGLLSINFWRNATDGIRRKLDLTIAKIAFIVYFIFWLFGVKSNLLISLIGWPIFIFVIATYKLSSHYWKFTKKRWLTYHVIFHALVVFGQCLIIAGSFEELRKSNDNIWNIWPFNFFNLNNLLESIIKWITF